MSKKIAFLMDDIKKININKDSSFAMLLEAKRRNYELWVFDSTDMFSEKNQVFATAINIDVFDKKDYLLVKNKKIIDLSTIKCILMRKDPPFNMEYIYATYLLEILEQQGVLVINRPSSLRDCNEKLFTLNFPHLITNTLVTTNKNLIKKFYQQHKTIILKPLDSMGGNDIFKIDNVNTINTAVDYLTQNGKRQIMAQRFIKEISEGDKRILIIAGKPIPYALARVPAKGNFKGNLAAGAVGIGQKLSDRDKYLCQKIAPTLIAKGLLFVGLDVIGDYITEINITSPTCIRELDKEFNLNIAGNLFDEIEKIIN